MDPREIQRLEELCVQDEAPFCQAACPLHVDVKEMLKAVARNDLEAGAKVYAQKAPFPGVLARICDQPCHSACKRAEAGGAIEIGHIERACAKYVEHVDRTDLPRSLTRGAQREERVAVVGAGLSGLTAAIELARRGYQATLIEASKSLGGRLRLYPPEILPTAVLDAELCALEEHGVELRLQTTLGTDVALADLLRDYQAVCLCTGPNDCLSFTASVGIDGTTLVTAVRGVFCGSAPGRESRGYSPVGAVADGLRVALSVDRFLKGESLTAGRDKEGSYRSRLETSLQGVEAAPAVTPGEGRGGYTREQAVLEARRCLQCECLQCVTACTYLQHFREYPGKCIRKVTKNLISVPGKSYRTFTPFINACALCGLCGSVCPTDLDMAVVNGRARRIMCEQGVMPPAIHHFAIEDMESSNSAAYAFARNQPGWESSSHLFFPGCQLAASLPDKVVQTYQFLMTRLEGGVGMATGCCGAPAQWSGRELLYEQTTDALKEHWRSLGRPRLISACPTCLLISSRDCPRPRWCPCGRSSKDWSCLISFPAGTARPWHCTIRAPPGATERCRMPPATSWQDSATRSRSCPTAGRRPSVAATAD